MSGETSPIGGSGGIIPPGQVTNNRLIPNPGTTSTGRTDGFNGTVEVNQPSVIPPPPVVAAERAVARVAAVDAFSGLSRDARRKLLEAVDERFPT